MIRAIALVDLDDTLFQTRRKCPPGVELTPYAYAADGSALSFATPAQLGFIAWLEATALIVAVTARSTGALARTRLRWTHAVAAHGGVIDLDGTRSAEWTAVMAAHDHGPALAAMAARVAGDADAAGVAIRARVLEEDGLPLYLVVKHAAPEGDDAALHRACAPLLAAAPPGWTTHVNGNNVALLPPGLGKAHAVAWLLPRLRARHPGLPVIGIGDSDTDAAFMALCDFAMMPPKSQLARKWHP